MVALALVGDENQPHDLRAAAVEARVGLDVELLTADDWSAALLVVTANAVGVDLVVNHWA